MVVFTCNYCGDSVKKPKAEKHITLECRKRYVGSGSLCCIDCLVDFDAISYQSHTKCLTEEERYSAPGFVPKSSSCKNEKKQNSWTCSVQTVLFKTDLTETQKFLLKSISEVENVPRKKSRFLNFIKNSSRYRNIGNDVIESVFDLIQSEFCSASTTTNTKVDVKHEEKSNTNVSHEPEVGNINNEQEKDPKVAKQKNKKNKNHDTDEGISKTFEKENTEPTGKSTENIEESDLAKECIDADQNEDEGFKDLKKSKKKKRDKKNADIPMEITTEAGLNGDNVERNVESINNEVDSQNDDSMFALSKSKGKKKHKNKNYTSIDKEVVPDNENNKILDPENTNHIASLEKNSEEKPQKKKKKRKLDQEDETEDDVNSKRSRIDTTENEITPKKFSWENIVKTLLIKSKDHEMSVKKMTKKVVAEYQSSCDSVKSVEEIEKIFHKKVKKLPFVIISKDRIQLYVD